MEPIIRSIAARRAQSNVSRKQVFTEVGGFDERFPINYNDVDLCSRILASGWRIVYDSSVLLRHYECQTRRDGCRISRAAVVVRLLGGQGRSGRSIL
jgi:GT2 family glycosyltransferase